MLEVNYTRVLYSGACLHVKLGSSDKSGYPACLRTDSYMSPQCSVEMYLGGPNCTKLVTIGDIDHCFKDQTQGLSLTVVD